LNQAKLKKEWLHIPQGNIQKHNTCQSCKKKKPTER